MTVVHEPRGLPPEWLDVAAVVRANLEHEVRGQRTVTSHYCITSHERTAADLLAGRKAIGALRTGGTGFSTWCFASIAAASERSMPEQNLAIVRRADASLLRRTPGKPSGVTKRLKAGSVSVTLVGYTGDQLARGVASAFALGRVDNS